MDAANIGDERTDFGGANVDADYDLVACDGDTSAAPRLARSTTVQSQGFVGPGAKIT